MTSTFESFLLLAMIATGYAVWTVGFSRRWREDAKKFLSVQFGPGPNDDGVAEQARQASAKLWLWVATAAWIITAAAYRYS